MEKSLMTDLIEEPQTIKKKKSVKSEQFLQKWLVKNPVTGKTEQHTVEFLNKELSALKTAEAFLDSLRNRHIIVSINDIEKTTAKIRKGSVCDQTPTAHRHYL